MTRRKPGAILAARHRKRVAVAVAIERAADATVRWLAGAVDGAAMRAVVGRAGR